MLVLRILLIKIRFHLADRFGLQIFLNDFFLNCRCDKRGEFLLAKLASALHVQIFRPFTLDYGAIKLSIADSCPDLLLKSYVELNS